MNYTDLFVQRQCSEYLKLGKSYVLSDLEFSIVSNLFFGNKLDCKDLSDFDIGQTAMTPHLGKTTSETETPVGH